MKNIKLLDQIANEWHNTCYNLIVDAEAKERICDEAITRAFNMGSVGQSLPMRLSKEAYMLAHKAVNYEEFLHWWERQEA